LKELTRGKKIGKAEVQKFIKTLKIPAADKNRLLKLTPETYVGLAEKLVDTYDFQIMSMGGGCPSGGCASCSGGCGI